MRGVACNLQPITELIDSYITQLIFYKALREHQMRGNSDNRHDSDGDFPMSPDTFHQPALTSLLLETRQLKQSST